MGAALYLSFLLLVFCLSRAARTNRPGDPAAIDPACLPDSVARSVRRAARGLTVAEVRVTLSGTGRLRYQVSGLLPDGRALTLDVHDDGTVYRRDRTPAAAAPGLPDASGLPDAVCRRLRQSLPSFRPTAGSVRRISGGAAVWYEMDGLVSDDQPASLRISPDGRAFHLTVAGRPA